MKGKKHSPEQIIKKLREADAVIALGKTVGQVLQSLEISEQTLSRWRNQYSGMKSEPECTCGYCNAFAIALVVSHDQRGRSGIDKDGADYCAVNQRISTRRSFSGPSPVGSAAPTPSMSILEAAILWRS